MAVSRLHPIVGLLLGALLFGVVPRAYAVDGDLDRNGEVNLLDVQPFVGCLDGPGTPVTDPTCDPAHFDTDTDVDLRDFAGLQTQFGFGVGPPRIDRFWPTPGEWIVDDIGLTHVQVGFTEPVNVPREAIIVWLVSRGIGDNNVESFTFDYEAESDTLTIMFDPPIRDDRVTLVLDYTIEDLSGRPLDGEILNPHDAFLPSGDGHNGGQAVFRINVLQGDANRDGVVDEADSAVVNASLGLCDDADAFNPDTDLNGDGCVDDSDVNIVAKAVGRVLPTIDGTPPSVVWITADGPFGSFDTLYVSFSDAIDGYKVNERTCFLLDTDDNVIVPLGYGWGAFGDGLSFGFIPGYAHCLPFRINLSNAIVDLSGELLVPQQPCTCLADCPPYGESP